MHRESNTIGGLAGVASILLFISEVSVAAATTSLIPFGSGWRYQDFGEDAGANWFTAGYADNDWSFNFAQFGYGEGDEQTHTSIATTTYFRRFVTLTNREDFSEFTLRLLRDDGVAVYVNGTEVVRDNLPANVPLNYDTLALANLEPPTESELVTATLSPSLFVQGVNLIAAEVHQAAPMGSDMSFNLELVGTVGTNAPPSPTVIRGPYLQVGTSSNLTVRWRTSSATDTRVDYGADMNLLNQTVSHTALATDHEIKLSGLQPDTKYFYAIRTSTQLLANGASYYFVTAPIPGTAKPTRIWAIGDFGTGFAAQRQVRNAYTNFTANRHTDAWLFLGDNAYHSGLDAQYQSYVFDVYPRELRRMVVWPAIGNHETAQSQSLSDDFDYYRIFTMPTNGEAGGVPSGTEHYYSYDFANIHFIVLDSMTAIYRQPDSAMAQWLKADLADTTRDWIIAYFHHPPYTKGSHNSDAEGELIEMRRHIVPILEEGGVDMVLSGHSHCFERSFLIDGYYGLSLSVNATNFIDDGDGRTDGAGAYLKPAGGLGARRGTVYVVDGSSGGQGGGGDLDHPAMFYSTLTHGSLVIDVEGLRLDGRFVTADGEIDDTFTVVKGDYPGAPQPALQISRGGTNLVISWPTSVPVYRLESAAVLPQPEWVGVSGLVQTNGRRKTISVTGERNREFFRLRRVP